MNLVNLQIDQKLLEEGEQLYNVVRCEVRTNQTVNFIDILLNIFKLNCETRSCVLYKSLLSLHPGTNQYWCHMKKHDCDPIRAGTLDPWIEKQTPLLILQCNLYSVPHL
jgi:hypothetical protein